MGTRLINIFLKNKNASQKFYKLIIMWADSDVTYNQ